MWVAVGVVAAGAIGAAASTMAADKAAGAQMNAAERAASSQERMYEQTRQDFSPFLAPSKRAMDTLQSAIYGGSFGGETFTPRESEGFKYQQSRTMEGLDRALRAMGRSSGTVGANTRARALSEMYAANEEQAKQDLWNLVKTGQGSAGTVGGLGGTSAATAGQFRLQGAEAGAQSALAGSLINRGNLYGGIQGLGSAAGGIYDWGAERYGWGTPYGGSSASNPSIAGAMQAEGLGGF